MKPDSARHAWETYRDRELARARALLATLGLELDHEQPHTGGERFLMNSARDVGGGGYKLVLLGRRVSDQARVIIKISSDKDGIREIETEHRAREILRTITFAYRKLHAPAELLYITGGDHTLSVTAHINQDQTFVSRPLKEQLTLSLQALKAQESVHATTSSHVKAIRRVFGVWGARDYLHSFATFRASVTRDYSGDATLATSIERAETLLHSEQDAIEQYCGFLTHADFVPHNLRVYEGNVYLLDAASLHFGNKYESWARFLNFMLLYNRDLERSLLQYLRDNRTPEELESLRLMRIYKLGTLLAYYTHTLSQTSGELHMLNQKRIDFWRTVLDRMLDKREVPEEVITGYQRERDTLRSEEEKKRQEALH